MITKIQKENGKYEAYNIKKASQSIYDSMKDCKDVRANKSTATKLAKKIDKKIQTLENPTTNDWAEECIKQLSKYNKNLAKHYKATRHKKQLNRLKNSNLMKSFKDILYSDDDDPNSINNENANIDGKNSAAQLHRIASETNKEYILNYLLPQKYTNAHREGYIHLHDLDYYNLNQNCLQIDLKLALKNGYNTGNTKNNEPQSVMTAAMLACIVLQAAQNGQHGGISLANITEGLSPYVNKSYRKNYLKVIEDYELISGEDLSELKDQKIIDKLYYGITEEQI